MSEQLKVPQFHGAARGTKASTTLLLTLLSISTYTYADSSHNCQGNSCNETGTPAEMVVTQDMGQSQDQSQIQGSEQTQTQNAQGGGGGNATVIRESGPSHVTLRRVAPIVLGAGNTTAPCFRWFGLGLGSKDANAGIGLPFADKVCLSLVKFRLLTSVGAHDAAIKEYCYPKSNYRVYGSRTACEALLIESISGPRVDETDDLDAETIPDPTVYDDSALSTAIDALGARVSAVETNQTKTEAKAQERARVVQRPRADPLAKVRARLANAERYE